jgi:hypothetical protein
MKFRILEIPKKITPEPDADQELLYSKARTIHHPTIYQLHHDPSVRTKSGNFVQMRRVTAQTGNGLKEQKRKRKKKTGMLGDDWMLVGRFGAFDSLDDGDNVLWDRLELHPDQARGKLCYCLDECGNVIG